MCGLLELPPVEQTQNDSTRNLYHIAHELNLLSLVQGLWLSMVSGSCWESKAMASDKEGPSAKTGAAEPCHAPYLLPQFVLQITSCSCHFSCS